MVSRIGGLASGMDIDGLVEKLMKAERAPLYKLQQQKTKFEWQRDSYRSINSKLKTFSDYTFDNLILSSSFIKKTPNVTGINSNKVSINAGTGASGSLSIQAVKQLATNANTGVKDVQKTSHRFANENDSLGLLGVTDGTIKINVSKTDSDGTVTTTTQDIAFQATDTIQSFVGKLKDAGLTDTKYDVNTGKFFIGGTNTTYSFADVASEEKLKTFGFSTSNLSTSIKLSDGKTNATKDTELSAIGIAGTLSLKIGDETKVFTIDNSDTIESLMTKLNADDTGIKASYDEKTGKFIISSTDKTKSLTASNNESYDILNNLGIKKTGSISSAHIVKNQAGDTPQTVTGSNVLGHLGLSDGSLTLNVVQANGEMKKTTISYSKNDTIDSFIKKLNTSGAGVTAILSNGQLTMTANNSGASKEGTSEIQVLMNKKEENGVVLEDNSGKVLMEKLGFITDPSLVNSSDPVDLATTRGQNAIYAVNGLYMESNLNSVNVSGYEIKLNGTFNESAINGQTIDITSINPNDMVQVSSTNDIDSMVDKIKEFVSKYNELIAGINDQLKQTRYRDYLPLTSEQRSEMSESEQKLWDEKSKSGLLRGDSILREGLNEMRYALGGRVNGIGDNVIDTLAEMGITTSSSYNDGGKLVIDETKLRKALAEDPDRVINTLTQDGEKDKVTGEDTRGLLRRMRESITDFTSNIERKAGRATMTDNQYAIGKSLISTDERITKLQARLKDVETRYWRQFSAMEKAINKANQQSSMFMQG